MFRPPTRPSHAAAGLPLPLAVCLTCSGYSPAKSMRGFRSLRAQPSDFILPGYRLRPVGLARHKALEGIVVNFIFAVKKKKNPGSDHCFCG